METLDSQSGVAGKKEAGAGEAGGDGGAVAPEATSKKAIQIVNRVRDKLTGESASGRVSKL